MNAQPQAQLPPKDETKKDSADFKNKLAKFINPFYVSFVIFWVVCNYDFLLILIGEKAILHELYTHFGYGCKSGKAYVACTGKKLWFLNFPLYFLIWKVAIPLGLTWLHAHFVYPLFIQKINVKHQSNVVKEVVDKEIENWKFFHNEVQKLRVEHIILQEKNKELKLENSIMGSKF